MLVYKKGKLRTEDYTPKQYGDTQAPDYVWASTRFAPSWLAIRDRNFVNAYHPAGEAGSASAAYAASVASESVFLEQKSFAETQAYSTFDAAQEDFVPELRSYKETPSVHNTKEPPKQQPHSEKGAASIIVDRTQKKPAEKSAEKLSPKAIIIKRIKDPTDREEDSADKAAVGVSAQQRPLKATSKGADTAVKKAGAAKVNDAQSKTVKADKKAVSARKTASGTAKAPQSAAKTEYKKPRVAAPTPIAKQPPLTSDAVKQQSDFLEEAPKPAMPSIAVDAAVRQISAAYSYLPPAEALSQYTDSRKKRKMKPAWLWTDPHSVANYAMAVNPAPPQELDAFFDSGFDTVSLVREIEVFPPTVGGLGTYRKLGSLMPTWLVFVAR